MAAHDRPTTSRSEGFEGPTRTDSPKISVYGSFHSKRFYRTKSSRKRFQAACRLLGRRLAEGGFRIVVCSSAKLSADRQIMEGALPVLLRKPRAFPSIIWMEEVDSTAQNAYFMRVAARFPGVFTSRPIRAPPTGTPQKNQLQLDSVETGDALVLIGGALATYTAGRSALAASKPTIPIGSFGGAAAVLAHQIATRAGEQIQDDIGQLAGSWSDRMADVVVNQLKSQTRATASSVLAPDSSPTSTDLSMARAYLTSFIAPRLGGYARARSELRPGKGYGDFHRSPEV